MDNSVPVSTYLRVFASFTRCRQSGNRDEMNKMELLLGHTYNARNMWSSSTTNSYQIIKRHADLSFDLYYPSETLRATCHRIRIWSGSVHRFLLFRSPLSRTFRSICCSDHELHPQQGLSTQVRSTSRPLYNADHSDAKSQASS
jgi:hypothetical protein